MESRMKKERVAQLNRRQKYISMEIKGSTDFATSMLPVEIAECAARGLNRFLESSCSHYPGLSHSDHLHNCNCPIQSIFDRH